MDKTVHCPSCRHPGFDLIGYTPGSMKPEFSCQKCSGRWQSGKDGEPYMSHYCVDGTSGASPEDWVKGYEELSDAAISKLILEMREKFDRSSRKTKKTSKRTGGKPKKGWLV